MIIDLIDNHIVVPDPQILSGGLQGPNHPSFTFLSQPDSNGMRDLVYMKSKSGFPYDWLRVGKLYGYQLYTENKNWSNPQMLKAVMGNGARRWYRQVDFSYAQPTPGNWNFSLQTPETDYFIFDGTDYSKGGITRGRNNFERCSVVGPFQGKAIGDIPVTEEWQLWFERNGNSPTGPFVKEIIYCRTGWGRIGWEQYDNTGKLTDSHFTTTIIPGPVPTPVQQLFAVAQ